MVKKNEAVDMTFCEGIDIVMTFCEGIDIVMTFCEGIDIVMTLYLSVIRACLLRRRDEHTSY